MEIIIKTDFGVNVGMMNKELKKYEVWEDVEGNLLLCTPGPKLTSYKVRKLCYIEAQTWEEACAIYHLRMGFEPYKPDGEAESCPKCSMLYYPLSSGECWNCEYKN